MASPIEIIERIAYKKKKRAKDAMQGDDFNPFTTEDVKQSVEVPVKEIKPEDLQKIEKEGRKKPIKKKTKEKARIETKIKEEKKIATEEIIPEKKYELIITEKPQAAFKIAYALADNSVDKKNIFGVPYYELRHENKDITVACAVGHLFTLAQIKTGSEKNSGWPVFNIEWKENFKVKKRDFSKKYHDVILKLTKNASEIIMAMDYDTEGEVIGLNIVRYICKKEDAERMKFSTLTASEIREAYENKSKTINWNQAIAGETRHFLDWLYGINLSRALMSAIKKAGSFRIMSIGRVQGPALKLIVDKEKQIQEFKPEPYWQVFLKIKDKEGKEVEVKYIKDISKKEKNKLEVFKNLKGKEGQAETKKTRENILPPVPFDLTTLQTEAYKFFGVTPSTTLQIAQQLYLAGLISYPRTSSQKLPLTIGYKKILERLAGKFPVTKYALRDKPIEGKKTDSAHPSIYPTGEFASLREQEKKVYELIVKRFISCFAPDAVIDYKKIEVLVDNLKFDAKGLAVREKGWLNVYPARFQEKELPDISGTVKIIDVKIEEKTTQPPRRYTPASIVSELERKNLGTKCLTGDTKIIFNGNAVAVKELFDNGKPLSKESDTEIRRIEGKTISLTKEGNPVITYPTVISRRKLRKNEKVIEVTTDSSSIRLTEDHLLYIFKNNKIELVQTKNVAIEDKIVGILKNYQEGEIVIEREIFNNRFKNKNNEIKHKFSSKTSKGILISKFPIRWSSSLAWVLGYYYGDGSYSDPKYNGSHQISFTTTEKKALGLLKSKIKEIFGVEPYCYDLRREYKVNCNSAIAYALIKKFPELNGKKPFNIPKEFIGDFLRGLFDADGNIHLRPLGKTKIKGIECNSFNTPRVKLALSNKNLIGWVSSLLKDIGISNNVIKSSSLCNGKRFDCWVMRISGRERIEKFAYKVGFETYKEEILYKGLGCASKNYKILRNGAKMVLLLFKKPMKIEGIINETKLRKYEVLYALLRLFKMGVINKKRFSQAKRYIYSLKEKNLDYIDYCMKVVYEKIAKDLYKIPVREITEVVYNDYVYDISVEKDSPNFITEGNLLVHNSTRAAIIETLYSREYIKGTSIEATPLGIKLIESLEKNSPIIIDEKLTRHFEQEISEIEKAKIKNLKEKQKKILNETKGTIEKISENFKEKELEIGKDLIKANSMRIEELRKENEIIECPICKKGKLRILYNKNSRRFFVACNNYPECKTTFTLPPYGLIKKADKICEVCGFPKLLSIRKGKKPWEFCFNPQCESRKEQNNKDYTNKKD